MTRADHASGTDRIAEAAAALGLAGAGRSWSTSRATSRSIAPGLIQVSPRRCERNREASMSTACHPIHDEASLANPNVVKVVLDAAGYALYFSRSRIPFPQGSGRHLLPACRHLRLPGRLPARRFAWLKPRPLEETEALEQLRVLWHGYRIAVAVSEAAIPPGVDTPQDLEAVRKMLLREMTDALDPARPAGRRQGHPGRFHHARSSASRRSPPATCCAPRSRRARRSASRPRR